jgi:ankyrin repeat protein
VGEDRSADEDGRTPLHWAADLGHAAAVRALLAAGADPDVQDAEGMTPLHCAAVCEHRVVCELLLAAGADAHLQDADGETAAQAMPAGWRPDC